MTPPPDPNLLNCSFIHCTVRYGLSIPSDTKICLKTKSLLFANKPSHICRHDTAVCRLKPCVSADISKLFANKRSHVCRHDTAVCRLQLCVSTDILKLFANQHLVSADKILGVCRHWKDIYLERQGTNIACAQTRGQAHLPRALPRHPPGQE